ncbi:hypothetical protein JDW24_003602 [Salmonella enterica subsp. enterica serovar Uganda]|nr:hypothetical protein [Salmonella enterica subsp. enterica serovar Uganda]
MTTITKERVAEIIHAAGLEPCDYEEVFGSIKTGEIVAMARIALASLEAEAVAEVCEGFTLRYIGYGPAPKSGVHIGDRLYTAPPAPVFPATLPCAVELKPGLIIGKGCKTETLLTALQRRADYYAEIDAMTLEERAEHDANIAAFKAMLPQPVPVVPDEMTMADAIMEIDAKDADRWTGRIGFQKGWNACRAAMLQGDEPVSDELPDDFISMLTGRAKYLREKGEIKSPELLERAAAALQGENADTTAIPNGWKLVPIDPTKDMLRAGQSVVGFWLNTVHCYSKMLAAAPAAPQQEE